ncbi:hypothetical protein ACFY15_15600 [Streptomyces sp. NPDC001373]|uniref:hypothetical protein n=1 Tax=Streptomyces sp. NPDC001373 TaxID=3364565 RepID=UPI0036B723B9
MTARWPLGPVCTPCYRTARSHPMPCPDCDRARVLIGRAEHRRVCDPCAGVPDPYACERCAGPRSYEAGRLCDGCAVADHLEELFTDVPEAVGSGPLAAMRAALAEIPDAGTVLNWLRGSRSARLLRDLMATGRPLSRSDLDATIDGRGTAMTAEYLRGLLMAYQVLEPRDELAVRIVRHLERTVARHPEHGALLRAYVRWSLLPRAKRHQAAGAGGVKHRIRWACTRINLAAELLTTAVGHGVTIAPLDQGRLDTWLAANPGTRYEVRDFVVWAHAPGPDSVVRQVRQAVPAVIRPGGPVFGRSTLSCENATGEQEHGRGYGYEQCGGRPVLPDLRGPGWRHGPGEDPSPRAQRLRLPGRRVLPGRPDARRVHRPTAAPVRCGFGPELPR